MDDRHAVPRAVDKNGNFAQYSHTDEGDERWIVEGPLDGHALQMFAYDGTGVLWGINSMHEAVSWNGETWGGKPRAGVLLRMVAFDRNDAMWGVDLQNQVVHWDDRNGWESLSYLGGRPVNWLCFT